MYLYFVIQIAIRGLVVDAMSANTIPVLVDREISPGLTNRMKRWQPLATNFVALNVDGASRSSLNRAAARGVLRHAHGNWITGFCLRPKPCSAYRAELWRVLKGLTVAWDSGHRRIDLQIDNSIVVKVINLASTVTSHNYDLIQAIRRLLLKQWVIEIRRVFHEGNIVADRVANMGMTQEATFMLFDVPPPSEINSFLLHDVVELNLLS
ncbi:Non-LTR retroelement reverse transcriptase-like [Theobroma cacao]|uniref:Non-LTR retroelement reverse transcriptase-like n=1 Tax=Theobroma cacao TaxID=3641 RepID=A0A061F6N7_THECC|nr:Non-LTR retroelement reverse transcriptase-like [Theobroma cacao]